MFSSEKTLEIRSRALSSRLCLLGKAAQCYLGTLLLGSLSIFSRVIVSGYQCSKRRIPVRMRSYLLVLSCPRIRHIYTWTRTICKEKRIPACVQRHGLSIQMYSLQDCRNSNMTCRVLLIESSALDHNRQSASSGYSYPATLKVHNRIPSLG